MRALFFDRKRTQCIINNLMDYEDLKSQLSWTFQRGEHLEPHHELA
ncbi:hypothetical protein Cflav_PD2900 [Pedosphaera parvula Ellin514]|uniref:Uncharacterized protein n=1 Tax=Pedosphaera parvula (strain Ellin514) TaxID=320771 RepID=B9XMJ9_PEDPL|nr:hypothetical protein Cflav_PD2900 [Pedosphaera parvula Ellin514]